ALQPLDFLQVERSFCALQQQCHVRCGGSCKPRHGHKKYPAGSYQHGPHLDLPSAFRVAASSYCHGSTVPELGLTHAASDNGHEFVTLSALPEACRAHAGTASCAWL